MTPAPESSLSLFDPVVADWFRRRIGTATRIQERAWSVIASGRHVLVTAPTGSGKTLAAFLWPLNQILTGAWEGGKLRVLYVSPLKALNNDIQRNLLGPLAELEEAFLAAGREVMSPRVRTRSGDTSTRERQAILRHPPEILITTPESLNLLLTSPRGRRLFDGLETVILDEIHAVAQSKRGTHLITGVDRLVPLSGEFQRVALSATVRPVERISRFVAGLELSTVGGEAVYDPRPIEIVSGDAVKQYEIEVCRPQEIAQAVAASEDLDAQPSNLWESLAEEFRRRIHRNRSTLLFANNRRTTEKLTRLLNEGEERGFVYSHHGSLSREIRTVVEQRLKDGELRALVATNSLELGIDIGALDEVLLVKTPPSIASAVQRIGRAGHRVGETSHGRFYPLLGRDILEAAVVARAVEEHDIEEIRPIEGALDVLAQVILSMTANETWQIDDLFDRIRSSYPYRKMSRRQFDLVVEMLTGRYAESRVRELDPRVSFDRIDGTLRGRPGTARLVYLSGGTIADRGYFHLRLHDSMAKLGELDEEFVWERSLGDTFTLGAQAWRIRRITHNDVLVSPVERSAAIAPFWRAEERDRSFHLSERIGEFLESAEALLATKPGAERLRSRLETLHQMRPAAADALLDLLCRQRSATGGDLPHRHHFLVERSAASQIEAGRSQLTLHTGWGGRVNRPLAIALAASWEERYGVPLEIEHDNDCLLVTVSGELEAEEMLELVRADNLETLLHKGLETTGFFGARFRENAACALLLPRSGLKRRVPLWLQRERGKKLLKTVARFRDFPIVVETWRTCLQDAFEIETLKRLLGEIEDGLIRVSEVTTETASPFAADLRWKQTNRLMYEDDTPEASVAGGLTGELLREIVFSSQLRPRLPAALIAEFEAKLQRIHPGYAPRTAVELVEWVKERVLVPKSEWIRLASAVVHDAESRSEDGAVEVVEAAMTKLAWISAGEPAIVAVETVPRLARALGRNSTELGFEHDAARDLAIESSVDDSTANKDEILEQIVGEWIRFYGPFELQALERAFGLERSRAEEVLESLIDSQQIVVDRFRDDEAGALEGCDAENLERLLRLLRARARPSFATRPLEQLPLFLATFQGLSKRTGGSEELKRSLEQLLLWPAPVRLWESEILPARLEPYYPEWLDGLIQDSDLTWSGCGREKACFVFSSDLELLGPAPTRRRVDENALNEKFPDQQARYSFSELLAGGANSAQLSDRLWRWAWQGAISNTTFLAVRKGALSRFKAGQEEDPARSSRVRRRGRRDRWQASRPFSGDWYRLPQVMDGPEPDPLEQEELCRERVRILLDRYGILFRELLARELPAMRWGALFRSLRLMELSGEIVSGHFFADIPGPQFASRSALRLLAEEMAEDSVFWLNAVDPASPCGLGLEAWRGRFPARRSSNHVVIHGTRRVVLSRRGGARLTIRVAPDHPDLPRYLEFLKVRLGRRFDPEKAVDVETINGQDAATSPYAAALGTLFSVTRERSALRLRRRY